MVKYFHNQQISKQIYVRANFKFGTSDYERDNFKGANGRRTGDILIVRSHFRAMTLPLMKSLAHNSEKLLPI
jgi:hypothetical protein